MTQPVTSVQRRRDDYIYDFDGPSTSEPSPAAPKPSPGVDAHVDRALNDAILYVGMNEDSAGIELGALQRATGGNVTAVMGHAGAKVDTKFGSFDLGDDAQVKAFAAKLVEHYGLPAEVRGKLEGLLLATDAEPTDPKTGHVHGAGRDEIARIALYMARAESGRGEMPSRLVLSGHSAGGEMWGDRAGRFELRSICELGRMFPEAAKQVEDLHFSGCFTWRPLDSERAEWREAFPNVSTMWGYDRYSGHAPVGDMLAWQSATLGRRDTIAESTVRAHPGVLAWSVGGDLVDDGADLAKLQAAKEQADARFDGYLSGRSAVHDPHEPRIHDDYATYQRLAARGDSRAADRAATLLRVRFYEKSVRGEFASRYGGQLGEAFRSLGLPSPDFSKLSREEALAQIETFREAAGAPPRSDVAEAWTILDRFARLDPAFVKTEWCH